eukprot:TRINITY_DN37409_c0_g2_i2.p1 TRINITY_DN37409_c0_g2~~TRINITY_DN37409_c0_g2_i2.p1  ORF type:complete len:591 (+),score=138.07 TRINITY_DN37409_c0_g2_i2:92-1774(+)
MAWPLQALWRSRSDSSRLGPNGPAAARISALAGCVAAAAAVTGRARAAEQQRRRATARVVGAAERELASTHLHGVVLYFWDPLQGPTQLFSLRSARCTLSAAEMTFVGRFALLQSVSLAAGASGTVGGGADLRFSLYAGLKVGVTSVVFKGNCAARGIETPYCLSIIVPEQSADHFVALSDSVHDRLLLLQVQLQGLLRGGVSTAVLQEAAAEYLSPFVAHCDRWLSAGPPSGGITVADTLFGDGLVPAPDVDFVAKALTALLSHHQCAVVRCVSPENARRWLRTLALVVSPQALAQSDLSAAESTGFCPDLYLQWVPPSLGVRDTDTLQLARLPCCVIDVDACSILAAPPLHIWQNLRTSLLSQLADEAQRSSDGWASPRRSPPHRQSPLQLLPAAARPAPMVLELVATLFALPPPLRVGFAAEWRRGLRRRAAAALSFVRSLREPQHPPPPPKAPLPAALLPAVPRSAPPAIAASVAVALVALTGMPRRRQRQVVEAVQRPGSGLALEDRRQMCRLLDLQTGEDEALVLAAAEALQPGVCREVLGDPDHHMLAILAHF